MTYTELLPKLLPKNFIEVCNTRPVKPPYPKNYNPNTKCDYHGVASGHSTEACVAFKKNVQLLIDSGWITFEEGQPNVES